MPTPAGTMRAVVAHGAGDVRLEERAVPNVGAGEIAVRIRYGGLCGSDLHYWRHGRVGDFHLREPLVLGHEVVGTRLDDDAPVAVHPATTCGSCAHCRAGRRNLCPQVRYLGSAALLPHVQGGFADVVVLPADQVVPLPTGLDPLVAAIAEPATVAWHAVHRIGELRDRAVLVTGAGPIGVLAVAALRAAGAGPIVVTDVAEAPLRRAEALGAHAVVPVGDLAPAEVAEAVAAASGRGLDGAAIDAAIESSGTSAGLGTCLRTVRRGGRVISLGLLPPGDSPFPGNLVVTRELELLGSFRFTIEELRTVLVALADGSLRTEGVVSHVLPVAQLAEAMPLAADPERSGKVLLDFGDPGETVARQGTGARLGG